VKLTFSDYVKKNGVDTFYFNSEIDNPRIKDPELFTKPNGEDVGIGYGGALISRFKSHGEVLEKFIINPLLNAKNCVILLDEPESGLSITNQFKLIDAIKTAVNNNCQLFIATHCYPIIEQFNVISLEHNQQMIGVDFITKIKNSHK
jgi:predicted ATPase